MTPTLTNLDKGRSASFVAFWATDFVSPMELTIQRLLFCTYRARCEISFSPLALNKHSLFNGALPNHYVCTEICNLPPDQDHQTEKLLYVQKKLTQIAPPPRITTPCLGPPLPAALIVNANQLCTYRTPFTLYAPRRDVAGIDTYSLNTSRKLSYRDRKSVV